MVAMMPACRDASAPTPRIDVDVDATVTEGPTVTINSAESATLRCRVTFEANATGSGEAVWDTATVRFYVGGDHSELRDTILIPPATVADIWDAAGIAAGESRVAHMSFGAAAPFAVIVSFRYKVSRGRQPEPAEASFDCGPKLPATSTPPTISTLVVQPASGMLDPGQPITVSFAAQSQVELVKSRVELSGACEGRVNTPEPMTQSAIRTVSVVPLYTCRSDRPLTVTVTVTDATGREVSRSVQMPVTVADRTPPTIAPFFPQPHPSTTHPQRATEHFTGEAIDVNYNAVDNLGLAWLVWEVLPSGVRDSVPVFGTNAYWARIPLLENVGHGPIQLRVHARDVTGLVSTTHTTAPGAMYVYPTLAPLTRGAQIPGEVRGIVIDSPRGVVYLMQPAQRQIAVMSLATASATRTIALPSAPFDLDITPQGDSLIVTLPENRALGVIDLRDPVAAVTLVPMTVLDASVLQVPAYVRIAANGKALVTLRGSEPRAYQLSEVNLRTGAQRLRADWGNGSNIGSLALERSHDASAVVLHGTDNQFQRYDAATDRFGALRTAAGAPTRPSVDAAGRRVAIGVDIYDEMLLPLRRVRTTNPLPFPPTALSASGEFLYSLVWDGIVRSRISDGAILDRVRNPIRFAELVRVSADDRWVVTADMPHGPVSSVGIVDLR